MRGIRNAGTEDARKNRSGRVPASRCARPGARGRHPAPVPGHGCGPPHTRIGMHPTGTDKDNALPPASRHASRHPKRGEGRRAKTEAVIPDLASGAFTERSERAEQTRNEPNDLHDPNARTSRTIRTCRQGAGSMRSTAPLSSSVITYNSPSGPWRTSRMRWCSSVSSDSRRSSSSLSLKTTRSSDPVLGISPRRALPTKRLPFHAGKRSPV